MDEEITNSTSLEEGKDYAELGNEIIAAQIASVRGAGGKQIGKEIQDTDMPKGA